MPVSQRVVSAEEFERMPWPHGVRLELVGGRVSRDGRAGRPAWGDRRAARFRPAPRGFLAAPDLAVEILSPTDSRRQLHSKARAYLERGVREVWVVNPDDRTVTAHRSHGPAQVLHAGEPIEGGDVIPGFACDVARLFK